ncbi:MAG TPA: glycogen/starch/alpha-glucan phosphorylase [Thermoanaerobaculia bacterium]|nr:glycogen/starch/alpha-glucan phosphorylase [Thermoanaerobaculia bacterium]
MKKRIPRPYPGDMTPGGIVDAFARRMTYSVARDEYTATDYDVYQALVYSVRDQMMDRWFRTQRSYYDIGVKRVYYLSLEFLLGRALLNNILNLGGESAYARAMEEIGYDLHILEEQESDAGLGNGGLGRLAACFLDSAATLGLAFYGYGIRYEYGIFRQRIVEGYQQEAPDNWMRYGNPWEIPRPDVLFPVRFYGRTRRYEDETGHERWDWIETQTVDAMAYDIPVVGFRNDVVNTLRLWAAKSSREFDLEKFNAGDYVRAVEDKNQSENISKVLYPPDDQYAGKELRLKQQYFFVSATLQDMIRRFRKSGKSLEHLPDEAAVQLNDTHPAIAIPELMRMLMDDERLEWQEAWDITERVFGYTNHTILAEALEVWETDFIAALLPRHLQIIEEIDLRLRKAVATGSPLDEEKVRRMAVIDEERHLVRMANLAIVGSHSVNGVAKLHSEILKQSVFHDFHELFPGRFNNKTNGITPRRWLMKANPDLCRLITSAIGDRWCTDLDRLRDLETHAGDPAFRESWAKIKQANKRRFTDSVARYHGVELDPGAMFDTQIKRIHEYKRQLLNALHVITLYHRIVDGETIAPRTVVFGGKAAPAYFIAKLIIKLINTIAEVIRNEPKARGQLDVFFLPNYGVTCAELLYPATDLSEQISTAGTEASGTGNMKAVLNGGLIIGTLDGANIEIGEQIGWDNIFIFGRTAEEIGELARSGYDPLECVESTPAMKRAVDELTGGVIARKGEASFQPIADILLRDDRYFHCADLASYVEMQETASRAFLDREAWLRRSITSVARSGHFSSDRTVSEYASEIWGVAPPKRS